MSDRYKILNLLSKDAAGGMYLAEDTMLGRKVVYRHIDAGSEDMRSDTWAEEMSAYAGRLCAFQHPNIITIYDVPIDQSGFSIVTQFVEGETLAERLTQGPLREIGAYRMAADLLEALHAAHDAGVYHGALHTGSIKRLKQATGGFRYLICDLGLNTLATMVKGEDIHIADPVLLAPELHGEDKQPDEGADLFMVGQLCYTALAGGHPFSGKSEEECASAHLAGELPLLTDYAPDLNPDFAAWVMKMCSGQPGERPESIDAATSSLRAIKVVDPDLNVPTAKMVNPAVPVATVPMAKVTGNNPTVPVATVPTAKVPGNNPTVPVATVPVATVPVATVTAKQQTVPVASVPMSTVPVASTHTGPVPTMGMQGSGDFMASTDSSNKTMIIVVVSLVVLVLLGVGLTIWLSGGDKKPAPAISEIIIPEDTKVHFHDPELISKVGESMELVVLSGEKSLDWRVATGPSVSSGSGKNKGKYIKQVSTQGRYQEYANKKIPVYFELGEQELSPNAVTDKAKGAKPGDGYMVTIQVPKQHKGSMIVTLFLFQSYCAYDIGVTIPGTREPFTFQTDKYEPGVVRVPIEIPNPKKGGFYGIKVTSAKDTSGDFAMGLCGIVLETR